MPDGVHVCSTEFISAALKMFVKLQTEQAKKIIKDGQQEEAKKETKKGKKGKEAN